MKVTTGNESWIAATFLVGYGLLLSAGIATRLLPFGLQIFWHMASSSHSLTRAVGASALLLTFCIVGLCPFYWYRFRGKIFPLSHGLMWVASTVHAVLAIGWLGLAAWEEKIPLDPELCSFFASSRSFPSQRFFSPVGRSHPLPLLTRELFSPEQRAPLVAPRD